jgi:hypothetical protein
VAELLTKEIDADFRREAERRGREIQAQLKAEQDAHDARTADRRQLTVLDLLAVLKPATTCFLY